MSSNIKKKELMHKLVIDQFLYFIQVSTRKSDYSPSR